MGDWLIVTHALGDLAYFVAAILTLSAVFIGYRHR